jgi:hypothetical protein
MYAGRVWACGVWAVLFCARPSCTAVPRVQVQRTSGTVYPVQGTRPLLLYRRAQVLFIVEQTACNLFEKQQWWAAEQSLEAQITVHYYCYIAELATQFHT